MIFGLTGDALDEDVRSFLDAGADCVLGKVQFSYSVKNLLFISILFPVINRFFPFSYLFFCIISSIFLLCFSYISATSSGPNGRYSSAHGGQWVPLNRRV